MLANSLLRRPRKFCLKLIPGAPAKLPVSHTCFNRLDLPDYGTDYMLLRTKMLQCLDFAEGYGGVD
jgi:hypothetical protein